MRELRLLLNGHQKLLLYKSVFSGHSAEGDSQNFKTAHVVIVSRFPLGWKSRSGRAIGISSKCNIVKYCVIWDIFKELEQRYKPIVVILN